MSRAAAMCTAQSKRTHEQCRALALRGTTPPRCRHHAGPMKARSKAAARYEVKTWNPELQDVDLVDPTRTLLRCLTVSAGRQRYYASLLEALHAEQKPEKDGKPIGVQTWIDLVVFSTYGEGGKTGEHVRGLVALEGHWLAETARLSKMALDAGVDERRVRVEEGVAGMLATAMQRAFALAKEGMPEVSAMAQALREIEGETA